MRKEYNDRWNAKLVNPGFTMAEYEAQRIADRNDDAIRRAFERHANKVDTDSPIQVPIKRGVIGYGPPKPKE